MKKVLFIYWTALLLLALAACGSPAATTADPVAVYESYLQAIKSKQLDEAISFVADDAVYLDPMANISGKEKIRAFLQGVIDSGGYYEVSDITNTNGLLNYKIKTFVNDQVYSGIGVTVIKDGKIIFDGSEALWAAACTQDASLPYCAEE
jgi:limonene-1,2-epoxide hydrolase